MASLKETLMLRTRWKGEQHDVSRALVSDEEVIINANDITNGTFISVVVGVQMTPGSVNTGLITKLWAAQEGCIKDLEVYANNKNVSLSPFLFY